MDKKGSITIGKAIISSIVAIVLLITSQLFSVLLGSLLIVTGLPQGVGGIASGVLYLAFAYILLKLFLEKIMKFDLAEMGITKPSFKPVWIITAVLLPLAVTLFYIIFIPGEYISSGKNGAEIFDIIASGVFFNGIAAGFVEEMVFRGVVFRTLEKSTNRSFAIMFPSLLFGTVHTFGAEYSTISYLLVIVAGTAVGIMFSMISTESGSIWNNGLVHAIWNMIIIGGAFTVSNKADELSVMTYVLKNDSFLVTGGEFGIESSVISLAAYVIVSVIAVVLISKKPDNRSE